MLYKKCLLLFLCAVAGFAQGPLARDPKAVVAVVDGKNVTWGDIQDMMLVAPPEISQGFQANPQVALMNWFLLKHLGQEGLERHLDEKSPTKEQIEAMKLIFLRDARMNEEANGFTPTPEMLEKYYQAHLDQYQRVRAKGVLIKFKAAAKPGATSTQDIAAMAQAILQAGSVQRSEADALALANSVAKQWREGGDIAALAEKYSEDELSKSKGGDLGYISVRSNHAGEVRTAAMSLTPNTISEPIRLAAGFFVIRAEERGVMPLDQVSGEVAQAVRAEHFNEWMSGLRDRFQVKITDPTIVVQPVKQGAQAPKPAVNK